MKMNGRNSSGLAVSLLNDGPRRPGAQPSQKSYGTSSSSSRDSISSSAMSASSSSSRAQTAPRRGFPPAPGLMRSGSWSSQKTNDSPSPKTPAYAYCEPRQKQPQHTSYFLVQVAAQGGDMLPKNADGGLPKNAVVDLSRLPSPATQGAVGGIEHSSSSNECLTDAQHQAATPTGTSWIPIVKHFPCQLAAEYGCTETFTTSGHASRHAKKHTGEKGVPCPKCPKRFARKDNMKQHLKTHENGRAHARCGTSGSMEEGGVVGVVGNSDQTATRGKSSKVISSTTTNKQRTRTGKRAGSPLPRLETATVQRGGFSTTDASPSSSRPTLSGTGTSLSSMDDSMDDANYRPVVSSRSSTTARGRSPQLGSYVCDLNSSLTTSPVSTIFSSPQSHHPHYKHPTTALTPGLDALVIAADVTSRQ